MSETVDAAATGFAHPAELLRFRSIPSWVRAGDVVLLTVAFLGAASLVGLTACLAWELFAHSAAARAEFGWSFLTSTRWNPVEGQFGSLSFIYGTVLTSFIALVIAVPMGIGTAVFLAELAPPSLSVALAFLIDLLAAVPSVLYGLLGIFVLVPALKSWVVPALQSVFGFLPIFSGRFYGVSIFSAGVVLAIMIVPFIISVSREILLRVPADLKEASYGLGATHFETVWKVVLPYAKSGILSSFFLALARALGETMAVTMVIGNDPRIAKSLLAPGYSIAAVIANEFTEATGDLYLSSLILLGLVLFGITFLINGMARLFFRSLDGRTKHHG